MSVWGWVIMVFAVFLAGVILGGWARESKRRDRAWQAAIDRIRLEDDAKQ